MKTWKHTSSIVLFFFALNSISYCQINIEKVLPSNWSIIRYISVPKDKLPAFGQKLGGELISIENYIIDVEETPLQINIIECTSDKDAQNVYNTLLTLQKSKEKFLLINCSVYEFLCENTLIMKKVKSLFNRSEDIFIWNVEFDIAPITHSKDMEWNKLFNLLCEYNKNENNSEIREKILKQSKNFEYGDIITFNNKVVNSIKPKYHIDAIKIDSVNHDLITFEINNPPKELDIPKIKVVASIPVRGFTNYKPQYDIDVGFYTMANEYWPSDDPKILSISEKILKDKNTDLQKLEAIQQWVYRNIKYDGIVGSRYGTLKVLEQNFGRCWDKCDILVTLCRAAQIPSRQIAGWVNGMSGHIWAESYINNEGWIQVDATVPFLGVSDDYVPFFIIETGEIPAVYWNFPILKRSKL